MYDMLRKSTPFLRNTEDLFKTEVMRAINPKGMYCTHALDARVSKMA